MEEIPSSWCFMVCPGGFPPTVGFDPCQPILRACSVRHVMTYAVAGEKDEGPGEFLSCPAVESQDGPRYLLAAQFEHV